MKNIYVNLLEIKDVSEQLQGLLLKDDMDLVVTKLAERQKLLNKMQELLSNSDIKSRKKSTLEIKVLIKAILLLDQKNKEEVKAKLNDLSNSLSFIGKEKQTQKWLRSATKVRRKKIVDILY